MADIISYVTIAGTSYRYKKVTPGGGGGGGDDPSSSASGGTLYAGTYFLRAEPNMSLAGDSTWSTFDDIIQSFTGSGSSSMLGDRFTIYADENVEAFTNLKDHSFAYTYYYERPTNSSGTPTLIPQMKQVDHMRAFTGTSIPANGKLRIGSYETADEGQGGVWVNSLVQNDVEECTENLYPDGMQMAYGAPSSPYDDTIYDLDRIGLKARTIMIPRNSGTGIVSTNDSVITGDVFKMWKAIAKLAPSKGDIINLPFYGGGEDSGNYPCRVLELNGTVAKVMRLMPYDVHDDGSFDTAAYDGGNEGLVYEGSSYQTIVNDWVTYESVSEFFSRALVEHDFEQILYGDDIGSNWYVEGPALEVGQLQPIDRKILATQKVRPLTLADITEYVGEGTDNLTTENVSSMLDLGSLSEGVTLMSCHGNALLGIDTSGTINTSRGHNVFLVAYVDLHYLAESIEEPGWEYGDRLTTHKYTFNYDSTTGNENYYLNFGSDEGNLNGVAADSTTFFVYTPSIGTSTTKALEINGVIYKFDTLDERKIVLCNTNINVKFVDLGEDSAYELVADTHMFTIILAKTDDYIAQNYPEFLQ